MSAKIIPIRPIARVVLPVYPLPRDGISLVGTGDDWVLTRHAGGQSVEMRLTRTDLLAIKDMIKIATRDA